MKRRTFLSFASSLAATLWIPIRKASAQSTPSAAQLVRPISIQARGAGRIGFYVDYSELSEPGTHRFYISRTHGTQGRVACEYQSYGDSHQSVRGSLEWDDGDASIRAIDVSVTAKSPGEHRIFVRLSSPTGGASLQFGDSHTTAYGVIDDLTIAADSDAVFFDTSAAENGTGTRSLPYNNIYDAIENVGAKRFIYGRGIVTVDDTNSASPFGQRTNCITPPASRSGDDTRLCLRNWPRESLIIQGDGQSGNLAGFMNVDDPSRGSWITYRGIEFRDFDNESTFVGGIVYLYDANGEGVNVELCRFRDINSHTNVAGFMPWGVNGAKMWRCSADRITVRNSPGDNNASGLMQTYDGQNISIQRCEARNSAHGAFQKRIGRRGDVSMCVRFSVFDGCDTHYSISGASGAGHSYSIVQCNIFRDSNAPTGGGITHLTENPDEPGEKSGWWCNNIFDNCGVGELAAIHMRLANEAIIFNNIMVDCAKVWGEIADDSPASDIEFADYNHEYRTVNRSQMYEWRGRNFSSAANLAEDSGFERNASRGDPRFVDADAGQYTLQPDSPVRDAGISGSPMGVYFTGIERFGPDGAPSRRPSRMQDFRPLS